MKNSLHKILFFLLIACILFGSQVAAIPSVNTSSHTLCFLENKGQIIDQYGHQRRDIDFRLQGSSISVFIGDGQLHYQWSKVKQPLQKPVPDLTKDSTFSSPIDFYRADMVLIGANYNAKMVMEDQLPYYERYYLPQHGSGAVASTCSKIIYRDIYPNIDWILYIRNNQVEYDFVIRPGGKVSDIKMEYRGATDIKMNLDGSITIQTPMGNITENMPYSFQQADNKKIASQFSLIGTNTLGFEVDPYEGTLVVDPVLSWGTYYGSSDLDMDGIVRCDPFNNVYLGGWTTGASNIATVGAHQQTYGGGIFSYGDAFLVKFNKDGIRQWATYYGGSSIDGLSYGGMAVDKWGYVYINGLTTSSSGIATSNGHQQRKYGFSDNFLAIFDTSGVLMWGTYYGGGAAEQISSIACDDSGNVYMAGGTNSPDRIATPNSHKSIAAGNISSIQDGFLVKFDSSGVCKWGTYFGGDKEDIVLGLTCSPSGVYIIGQTQSSSGIASQESLQDTLPPVNKGIYGFLAKFDFAGTFKWGTYYGVDTTVNSYLTFFTGVDADSADNVYLLGYTTSEAGIATPNSFQDTISTRTSPHGTSFDLFVAKFNRNAERVWGTYYGMADVWSQSGAFETSGSEVAYEIRCDQGSNLYFVGHVQGGVRGFTTSNAHQATYGGGTISQGDGFLAQFDTSGKRKWVSYYGGQGRDVCFSVDVDTFGYVYIAGSTGSVDKIATVGSHQDYFLGGSGGSGFPSSDVFLARFCFAPRKALFNIQGTDSVCVADQQRYYASAVDEADAYIWSLPEGWSGVINNDSIDVTFGKNSGDIKVKVVRCQDTSEAQSFNVYVRPSIRPVITVNGFELGTLDSHLSYQWYLNGLPITGETNATYNVMQNGDYMVVVTNPEGCIDSSDVYVITNVTVASLGKLNELITVYPNPVDNLIHIAAPVPLNINLSGIDGRILIQKYDTNEIDVSGLIKGVYLINIRDRNGVLIKTAKITKL